MEIYFVRHGETAWNQQHRLQGHSDIPLNDAGLAGARKAARVLKDISFDRIFSSPLVRAKKTAEIIAAAGHPEGTADVETREEITEMSFGTGEGIVLHGVDLPPEEKVLQEQLLNWFKNPAQYQPLPGGETAGEVKERCEKFLRDVLMPLEKSCERILVVAHGGILRSMESVIEHTPDEKFWSGPIAPNCGAMVCVVEDGEVRIDRQLDLIAMASSI